MRYVARTIRLMCLFLFIVGCKKVAEGIAPSSLLGPTPVPDANIVISNKTASAFTLTWPAGVDDTTSTAALEYKVVYSSSNNLTTASDAEANGLVALNWTANTLTASVSGLLNSTTYYAAVLVKDIDGNIGLANTNTLTLCTGKRMFLATASNGNLGGKTGADATCTAQKPAGLGVVKAMLSDNNGINTGTGQPSNLNGRQACYGNCAVSNLYVLDWVFAANRRYCTSDYTKKVGDSGVTYPVLFVTEANTLSETPVMTYSGFNVQFANSTTNCSNWTSTAGQFVGGMTSGIFSGVQSSFITGAPAFPNCTDAASIVCVEQ